MSKIKRIDDKNEYLFNLGKEKEEVFLYIVQAKRESFLNVIKTYKKLTETYKGLKVDIIFIPCVTYEIVQYLNDNSLEYYFTIHNLRIDLFPIDNDLLSLENEDSFKEIYIDKNYSSLLELANGFSKLESLFGKVKYKYIKGNNAKIFDDFLAKKEKENNVNTTEEVLGMIVFDRSIDFLTLFTSNYTYEGLIDDFFNIKFGKIRIKDSMVREKSSKDKLSNDDDKTVTFGLTTDMNKFYCKLRCMHYIDVNKYIIKTKEYYKQYAEEDKMKMGKNYSVDNLLDFKDKMTYFINEVKAPLFSNSNIIYHIIKQVSNDDYIKYLKNEQALLTGNSYINIKTYYEDKMAEKSDLNKILKLMIIQSLTQGGIREYNKLKREILNIYGYHKIFLFRNLEKIGLLKDKTKDNYYSYICEKLQLLNLDFNLEQIFDCSYVMSGYCPLTLRLIENSMNAKWNKINDILKKIPGELMYPENEDIIINPPKEVNTIFLVFVGGITYTEIEGIRYLNRKFKEIYDKNKDKKPSRIQLIIVTTAIMNSNKILEKFDKTV